MRFGPLIIMALLAGCGPGAHLEILGAPGTVRGWTEWRAGVGMDQTRCAPGEKFRAEVAIKEEHQTFGPTRARGEVDIGGC